MGRKLAERVMGAWCASHQGEPDLRDPRALRVRFQEGNASVRLPDAALPGATRST